MFDQADKLRELVRHSVKASPVLSPGLPLVVLSGGACGVGVSTIANQLAEELWQLGKRVVLVDANPTKADLAQYFEVVPRGGLSEVLEGKRSVTEVLQNVGEGIRLLAGIDNRIAPPAMNGDSLRRLFAELRALHSSADMVLVDAGAGMNPWVERLWKSAFQVLLVTSTEREDLMDSYATVKLAPWGDVDGKVRLTVNRCGDSAKAERIGEDFASTCRRFLAMRVISPAAPIAERFNKSNRGSTHSDAFRQTLRLLAADLLSSSLTVTARAPKSADLSYGAKSQAANLLAEIPNDRLPAKRASVE